MSVLSDQNGDLFGHISFQERKLLQTGRKKESSSLQSETTVTVFPSSTFCCRNFLKTCLADLPNNTEGGRKALFTILSVLSVSRQRNNRVVLHLSQIFLSTNEHDNSKSVILHHSNAGSLIQHGLGFNKGRTWDFQSLFQTFFNVQIFQLNALSLTVTRNSIPGSGFLGGLSGAL